MIHLRPCLSRFLLLAPVALGCLVACGRTPRPAALILDHHRELTGRKRELTARYAADLEAWFEAHQEADDATRARVELITALGDLGDVVGAERHWRQVLTDHPDEPAVTAAGFEMAEAALENADAEVARRVITDLCTGAYGYAHETHLVQNLATLLALEGRLTEAREAYDLVRAMKLYAEYPARFLSLEIFRDYLDRVGKTFPPLVSTSFDGSPLDTRDCRAGARSG